MIGFLLSGLGSAATAAGMTGLGSALTGVGATLGGGGVPGVGAGGTTPPLTSAPGSMPFGFDISKILPNAQTNLGTGGEGPKPISSQMDKDKAMMQGLMQQSQQGAAPMATPLQRPVDISQLMAAVQSRGRLGT